MIGRAGLHSGNIMCYFMTHGATIQSVDADGRRFIIIIIVVVVVVNNVVLLNTLRTTIYCITRRLRWSSG
jgi:hypothetical protein